MGRFKLLRGSRDETERELVEALFTPWDKQRLAMTAARLEPKGKLKLAHPVQTTQKKSKEASSG